mmetsp:Transcript_14911/g.56570  ORF Transcript_14911/g.56570 Transcript_14911/m.56570 type:complete len:209 (+) Transcript_14911:2016-2642(+)
MQLTLPPCPPNTRGSDAEILPSDTPMVVTCKAPVQSPKAKRMAPSAVLHPAKQLAEVDSSQAPRIAPSCTTVTVPRASRTAIRGLSARPSFAGRIVCSPRIRDPDSPFSGLVMPRDGAFRMGFRHARIEQVVGGSKRRIAQSLIRRRMHPCPSPSALLASCRTPSPLAPAVNQCESLDQSCSARFTASTRMASSDSCRVSRNSARGRA